MDLNCPGICAVAGVAAVAVPATTDAAPTSRMNSRRSVDMVLSSPKDYCIEMPSLSRIVAECGRSDMKEFCSCQSERQIAATVA